MNGEKRFTYGMKLRGFAPFCQPMNGLVDHRDTDKTATGFWSIISYNRKLTDAEVRDYELTPIED